MRLLLIPWWYAGGFALRIYKGKGNGEIDGFLEKPEPIEFRTLVGHLLATRLLDKYGRKKRILVFNSGRYFRVAVELNLPDKLVSLLKKLEENEKLLNRRKRIVEETLKDLTAKKLRHFLAIEKLVF